MKAKKSTVFHSWVALLPLLKNLAIVNCNGLVILSTWIFSGK